VFPLEVVAHLLSLPGKADETFRTGADEDVGHGVNNELQRTQKFSFFIH
jgi:hypothetical protein